ncbi:MAG: hypothetical protein ACREI9_14420, partial [Nitrospiraceae bacterium]
QSHTIDRLYTKVAVLENELAIAADQRDDLARVLDDTRGALVELQHWRVNITLASRMGWPRAVQYIRENPLPFPEEDPRGSR